MVIKGKKKTKAKKGVKSEVKISKKKAKNII